MTPAQAQRRARAQRALTWTGPAMFALWVGGWIAIARWIPPNDPDWTAQRVLEEFTARPDAIKIGMVIAMFASAPLVPFCAVISTQIRRIEGGGGPLASTQITSAAVLSAEFIIPMLIWMALAYRADDPASADVVRTLNDVGWIMFVVNIATVEVQLLSIAMAVFIDDGERPVLPRWVGYLNVWVAVGLLPAAFVLFFQHGAMAWNGLIGFFVPLTTFGIWVACMFFVLRRAIDDERASEAMAA